jgi:ribosome biogenesis GTPase
MNHLIEWTDITRDPWTSRVAEQLTETDRLGRIIAQDGPVYRVATENGIENSRPSGRLEYLIDLGSADAPSVGDYVALGLEPGAPIREVLRRRSVFERKQAGEVTEAQVICANVDKAIIVTTAPSAAAANAVDKAQLHDFSVRRVERFIATLDSRVEPVVVINKSDLIEDQEGVARSVRAELPGIRVIMISALEGMGVEAVLNEIGAGETAVLVGSSGSGKSTLISQLTGTAVRTGAIRAADGRGRHTTTGRRMYALPGGGMIVDTPGVREVQLWSAEDDREQLGSAFPEIDELAADCRFSDCRHESEPGCAVREAVQEGRVTHDRYLSYLQLQTEKDVVAARAEKRQRLNDRRSARKARGKRTGR